MSTALLGMGGVAQASGPVALTASTALTIPAGVCTVEWVLNGAAGAAANGNTGGAGGDLGAGGGGGGLFGGGGGASDGTDGTGGGGGSNLTPEASDADVTAASGPASVTYEYQACTADQIPAAPTDLKAQGDD